MGNINIAVQQMENQKHDSSFSSPKNDIIAYMEFGDAHESAMFVFFWYARLLKLEMITSDCKNRWWVVMSTPTGYKLATLHYLVKTAVRCM